MDKINKLHIGIYGRRNNGKSSIINVLAGQNVAIVSEIAGTTTDVVKKSFEITGLGAAILVDTAGIDDSGILGEKRIDKTLESLKIVDLAMLVVAENIFGEFEKELINEFQRFEIPFFIIYNKIDISPLNFELKNQIFEETKTFIVEFSATKSKNAEEIIEGIKKIVPQSFFQQPTLIGDLVKYGDIVLLITPIDVEAPAGRLILPQIQVIRDILDNDCVAIVLKEREVDAFLRKTNIKPALAITDSQIFLKAASSIPTNIPLTGFSIVFARLKGNFEKFLEGTPQISKLKDGDKILLLESCSHHVSCDDIGRVKIPRWISNFTGKKLEFHIVAGLDKIENIEEFAMVIQCGGCMITRKQVLNRLKPAIESGIPVSNYGMSIAYIQGIYQRAISPFVKIEKQEDYL